MYVLSNISAYVLSLINILFKKTKCHVLFQKNTLEFFRHTMILCIENQIRSLSGHLFFIISFSLDYKDNMIFKAIHVYSFDFKNSKNQDIRFSLQYSCSFAIEG